jgi:hypothetical protein
MNLEMAFRSASRCSLRRRAPAQEPSMPFSVIMFAVVALTAEALWFGLIGWWLLNLF